MLEHIRKLLRFISWPATTGILVAIVLLQYQQLQQLNEFVLDPAFTAPLTTYPAQPDFSEAIKKAAPAVVSINATTRNVESLEQTSQDRINIYLDEQESLGSGVIVSEDGFIITNFHVVKSPVPVFETVVTLYDGRSSPAKVVAYDESNDLAILHVNMENLTAIQYDEALAVDVGDIVFAIGYPRNIGQSVSQGIVSALNENKSAGSSDYLIQTDAAINPGNSGGALIDIQGNLIGINSSIFSESGRFEGIGFATPVVRAIRIMEELVSEAVANNPGYLGVLTGEVLNQETSMLFFGVPDIKGMLIENVDEGGPAQRAGLLPGDVITRVENTPVVDEETIILEIQEKRPGDHITVEVYRDGKLLSLPTILGFGEALVIAP